MYIAGARRRRAGAQPDTEPRRNLKTVSVEGQTRFVTIIVNDNDRQRVDAANIYGVWAFFNAKKSRLGRRVPPPPPIEETTAGR